MKFNEYLALNKNVFELPFFLLYLKHEGRYGKKIKLVHNFQCCWPSSRKIGKTYRFLRATCRLRTRLSSKSLALQLRARHKMLLSKKLYKCGAWIEVDTSVTGETDYVFVVAFHVPRCIRRRRVRIESRAEVVVLQWRVKCICIWKIFNIQKYSGLQYFSRSCIFSCTWNIAVHFRDILFSIYIKNWTL